MSETPLVAKFTEQEKHDAFEWLREYALHDDIAPDTGYALIMLLEVDRLQRELTQAQARCAELEKAHKEILLTARGVNQKVNPLASRLYDIARAALKAPR